jgi:hypothetical protein
MKHILPLVTILTVLFSSEASHAKGKKEERSSGTYGCAKFDFNQNGTLDPEERKALLEAFADGDTALKALDVNNDGRLDDSELAAVKLPAPEKEKKKKKKKGTE